MPQTRRDFVKLALAALPAAGVLSRFGALPLRAADSSMAAPGGKPNSKVNGVQIGLNVPYSFSNPTMSGAEVLAACVQLGVSGVELRAQPVETFLGAKPELIFPPKGGDKKGGAEKSAGGGGAKARAEELRQWRLSVSMDRVREFRKMYEDAGVSIGIMKVDAIYAMADDVLDYNFKMAKALGAHAISCEISQKQEDLARLGSFADKHQFWVGYHGHTKTGPKDWEGAFALAKYNGANVDLGHFVAGNNTSPVPFIKQYHDRITHVHVKDKKLNDGPNTPLGEGDTPIAEVLRLIRDNRWPIQATIEFEYKVPDNSDRMTEIAKCVKYCRDALA